MTQRVPWPAYVILFLCLYAVSCSVRADTNLVWSPTSAANRNAGSWQRAGDATLVLSGSSFGTASVVAFSTLADTAPVYICFADVPVGQTDGCPAPGVYTQERFGTKAQAARIAVTPPPAPVAGPACYPDVVIPAKLRTAALPAGVSTRYDRIAAWTCQTASGYTNEVWMFSLSQVIDPALAALAGVVDEEAARASCAQRCSVLTDAEKAYSTTWAAPYRASARVSANGSSTTRPVYALNADGSRQTSAMAGVRVAVGDACRLDQRAGGTSYYSVEGRPNLATADPSDTIPAAVALCSMVAPIGINQ